MNSKIDSWAWSLFTRRCWDEYQNSFCEKHIAFDKFGTRRKFYLVADCPCCNNG